MPRKRRKAAPAKALAKKQARSSSKPAKRTRRKPRPRQLRTDKFGVSLTSSDRYFTILPSDLIPAFELPPATPKKDKGRADLNLMGLRGASRFAPATGRRTSAITRRNHRVSLRGTQDQAHFYLFVCGTAAYAHFGP